MKLLTTIGFALLYNFSFANDGAFMGNGNHLIPITNQNISVQKEILKIKNIGFIKEKGTDYIDRYVQIDVYYEFYNHSKTNEKVLVGFEADCPSGDVNPKPINGKHPYMKDFTVNVNGVILPYEITFLPYKDGYHKKNTHKDSLAKAMKKKEKISKGFDSYSSYYVYHFNANFKPGLNIIKHRYLLAMSSSVDLKTQLSYVLTAANRWANNQIDDFTLIIDMDEVPSFFIEKTFFINQKNWQCAGPIMNSGSHRPDQNSTAEFISNFKPITFHKTNFHPEGELNLYQIGDWVAGAIFSDTLAQFQVPHNYPYQACVVNDSSTHQLMRNFPYALRGYAFKNKTLKMHYEKQSWYKVNYKYKPSQESLTKDEVTWIKNLKVLAKD